MVLCYATRNYFQIVWWVLGTEKRCLCTATLNLISFCGSISGVNSEKLPHNHSKCVQQEIKWANKYSTTFYFSFSTLTRSGWLQMHWNVRKCQPTSLIGHKFIFYILNLGVLFFTPSPTSSCWLHGLEFPCRSWSNFQRNSDPNFSLMTVRYRCNIMGLCDVMWVIRTSSNHKEEASV